MGGLKLLAGCYQSTCTLSAGKLFSFCLFFKKHILSALGSSELPLTPPKNKQLQLQRPHGLDRPLPRQLPPAPPPSTPTTHPNTPNTSMELMKHACGQRLNTIQRHTIATLRANINTWLLAPIKRAMSTAERP